MKLACGGLIVPVPDTIPVPWYQARKVRHMYHSPHKVQVWTVDEYNIAYPLRFDHVPIVHDALQEFSLELQN